MAMESEEEDKGSPEVFLREVGESLHKQDGIDDGLAKILQDHILTATPENDAVDSARLAIGALAEERALPHPEDQENG